ncbi:glucose/sorbosone dehydrogenase-like protein [Streptomyces sp. 3MP-14]|uniref:Glucose/sorbosone dehydrogenase-like protein n=1 Tax=Streptomyces mimosae TaxID=2586635 RepID=A0A5N6A0X7_9ACTN|nr:MULTISPECIES: PQQ-dependent sugar dehydrogenase [Streptomyces]KAB8161320.1 glucose/sorbosone dehydrogenase-like protein [Streptomyces mimosae]KAB8173122.1 glucose/sorbosone dehydrogenase-like protein [Streptomyces sp. 3MP-14]
MRRHHDTPTPPPHPRRRRGRLVAAALAVAVAPLGALAWTAGAAEEPAEPAAVPLENLTLATEQVAQGLTRPTAIAAPDDGTDRLFITEKAGTIREYAPETGLVDEPLVDLTDVVNGSGNERGLLGLEVAPDFADSQELYLAYTSLPNGDVTLARYGLADDSLEVLLTQEHPETNHNGGQLAFGPDGFLYWGLGDGGGAGDPDGNGQRTDTLLGTILRLDVSQSCGELAYCVPEDNPFVGDPEAREEIWAFGLRNPWRFSFDAADGSLWIGDVGQGAWEEVNHLAADGGGANFGWACREGTDEFDPGQCRDGAEFTEPVFTYSTSSEGCAVIGGHVYRGAEFAELAEGTYVATDYCSNSAWALRADGAGGYEDAVIGEFPTQVTAFGESSAGELYVVNDLPGQLHRVTFAEAGTGA